MERRPSDLEGGAMQATDAERIEAAAAVAAQATLLKPSHCRRMVGGWNCRRRRLRAATAVMALLQAVQSARVL
ncbi:MAG UNVERIFIED_CONTAM: hypothetical protein LVR18_25330 [Planctomycetaceae bacterium]